MLAMELPLWLTDTKPLDPSSVWTLVLSLTALLFWFIGYLLMVYRGFKDRSFGMPVAALCANLVWEGLGVFVLPVGTTIRIVQLFSFVPDLLILVTCLKYGPADFAHPLIKKWFYVLVGLGLVMATGLELAFMSAYRDRMGSGTGYFTNVLLSTLYVALILRRQSIRGQSFYIALCVLVGNAFAWPAWVLSAAQDPRPPTLFGHACFVCIISLNLIYAALIWRQCRLDGVNPWRRA